jgi:dUTP pyrophosphatase
MSLTLTIKRMPHAADLPIPRYETAGAAGLDLQAAVAADAPLTLKAGARALVPTGLMLALPKGFEAQVRPRSGLALKQGVTLVNAPGTIDSDYRGEIGVILINHGQEDVLVIRGMRIAQLVIAPVIQALLVEADVLDESDRGAGGFGSTGV